MRCTHDPPTYLRKLPAAISRTAHWIGNVVLWFQQVQRVQAGRLEPLGTAEAKDAVMPWSVTQACPNGYQGTTGFVHTHKTAKRIALSTHGALLDAARGDGTSG
jgi:hypothetical protein